LIARLDPIFLFFALPLFFPGAPFFDKMQEINKSFENGQDLKEVPRWQHRSITKALEWYEKTYESREEAMAQADFSGNYAMKEISSWFKVHYSTVSRAVRKVENA